MDGEITNYTYNHDGIRISKTVDGTLTDYLVGGNTTVAQRTGYDTVWFMYDSDGTRVGFIYHDDVYYYLENAQGGMMSIVGSDLNVIVEYSYDTWDRLLTNTNDDDKTNFIGKLNPFLYCGYYSSTRGLYVKKIYSYHFSTCLRLFICFM